MKTEDKRKLAKLEQQYFKETKTCKARLEWGKAKKLNPDTPCPPECQRIINLSTKKITGTKINLEKIKRDLEVYRQKKQTTWNEFFFKNGIVDNQEINSQENEDMETGDQKIRDIESKKRGRQRQKSNAQKRIENLDKNIIYWWQIKRGDK